MTATEQIIEILKKNLYETHSGSGDTWDSEIIGIDESAKEIASLIQQQCQKQLKELNTIRNNLYYSVPVGKIEAFPLIKIISDHLKALDEYLKQKGLPL